MDAPSSDSSPAQPADPAFALKGEARQLRAEAREAYGQHDGRGSFTVVGDSRGRSVGCR
jgi:hypothetical protein